MEKRSNTRIRTYLSGYIRGGKLRGEDCTIRDISVRGAKVLLTTELPLPAELEMIVTKWRQAYPVRVVWRKGREIGVEFCEPLDALSETDPKAKLLEYVLKA
jgi:hypothetical protein